MTAAPIDLDEMIREVRRELKFRRSVYARAVAGNRMNKGEADRRIDVMRAVLENLQAQSGEPSLLDQR